MPPYTSGMTFGSLTRWGLVRASVAGAAGGALFGAMFSSIAAGVLGGVVFVIVTLAPNDDDTAPPADGPRTLTIDLGRR